MRPRWRTEAPTLMGAGAFVVLALTMSLAFDVGPSTAAPVSAFPATPIALPAPGADRDHDGYGDAVDAYDGDLLVRINLEAFDTGRVGARPYYTLGTQDDHWRLGAGRELEWRHVVDPDPLGRDPGSPGWQDTSLRTGTWQRSTPEAPNQRSLGAVDAAPGDLVSWPQRLYVNVRDDQNTWSLDLAFMDADADPDRVLGAWRIDITPSSWSIGDESWGLGVQGRATQGAAWTELTATLVTDINATTAQAIAQRWAPILHFDAEERFYPLRGDALEQFHGFSRRSPDLRTWDLGFNDGTDAYRLLLADFDGDRDTDHDDAALLTDVLRENPDWADMVYAHVTWGEGGRVVLQYWFIYPYNFVLDETGRGVDLLSHKGDREFIQLTFSDLEAAQGGRPASISYSQHFAGIRIDDPAAGETPFLENATHPSVYPARGSHASYPAPGDDHRFRSSFVGFRDHFDGAGETWTPSTYRLELLQDQSWFLGYKWGPMTRYDRVLGTGLQPLLAHSFSYPFHEPVVWTTTLTPLPAAEVADLYFVEAP